MPRVSPQHDNAVDIIFESPELIEREAKSLYKEFPIKDCVLDALLRGEDGAILIVEVNTTKPKDAGWQVRYYRDTLKEVGESLFGVKPTIRGYIVMPAEWKLEQKKWINEFKKFTGIPAVVRDKVVKSFMRDTFPETIEESGFIMRVKYL